MEGWLGVVVSIVSSLLGATVVAWRAAVTVGRLTEQIAGLVRTVARVETVAADQDVRLRDVEQEARVATMRLGDHVTTCPGRRAAGGGGAA